jgi:hypothetical protein
MRERSTVSAEVVVKVAVKSLEHPLHNPWL